MSAVVPAFDEMGVETEVPYNAEVSVVVPASDEMCVETEVPDTVPASDELGVDSVDAFILDKGTSQEWQ